MKPLLMFALAALASTPVAARPPQVSAAPDIGRTPPPDRPAGRSGGTSPDGLPDLSQLAPDADPQVLALGLSAMQCAQAHGTGVDARRLAVIDYSRSSLTPRLWVFDLAQRKLLYKELVAHGQGSGGEVPDRFSNEDGTHASSLGLFYTHDTYQGKNGYSLRMQGLERGFNDAAMRRAIVMHGAPYVNADSGRKMGRLGRSWGCPALRAAMARPIIEVLKDGQFVFSYFPQQAWLTRSSLAQCAMARLHGRPDPGKALATR